MRYCTRPSRGATSVLSAILTLMRSAWCCTASRACSACATRAAAAASMAFADRLLPALVENFLRFLAALRQGGGAVELALGEGHARPLLILGGAGFVDRALRWNFGLRLFERRFEIARIHAGDDLAALTISPSWTRISAIRPANLVSMSISSASIRPLLEAIPAGHGSRLCCHPSAPPTAAATSRPTSRSAFCQRRRDATGPENAARQVVVARGVPPSPPRRCDLGGRVLALDLGLLAQNSLRVAESRDNHQTFHSEARAPLIDRDQWAANGGGC